MGLMKAIAGAAGGVLADQWKEFFCWDSIANDILIVKGQKHTSGRSSNTAAYTKAYPALAEKFSITFCHTADGVGEK